MFVDSNIHMSRKQYNGTTPCIDSELENVRIVYLSREELISKMKERELMFRKLRKLQQKMSSDYSILIVDMFPCTLIA